MPLTGGSSSIGSIINPKNRSYSTPGSFFHQPSPNAGESIPIGNAATGLFEASYSAKDAGGSFKRGGSLGKTPIVLDSSIHLHDVSTSLACDPAMNNIPPRVTQFTIDTDSGATPEPQYLYQLDKLDQADRSVFDQKYQSYDSTNFTKTSMG
jgi:hypothetical protein